MYKLVLVLFPVLSISFEPSLHAQESVKIVAFGDFGESTSDDQHLVSHEIEVLQSSGVGPSFQYGLALGDNFYPNGVAHVEDEQFRHKFIQVYQSLDIPFYLCLGNHDYGSQNMAPSYGNYLAQVLFTFSPDNPSLSDQNKRLWNMPERAYQANLGNDVELFALDTSPSQKGHINYLKQNPKAGIEKITAENDANWHKQLLSLQTNLRKSTAKWKLVMGHHPIISDGKNNDSPELMGLGRGGNHLHLRKVLCEEKVSAYISGHEHSLQLLPIRCRSYGESLKPISQIISGAGGNKTMVRRFYEKRGLFQSTHLGFVTLKFSDKFRLRFHEIDRTTNEPVLTDYDLSNGYPSASR